MDVTGNAWAVWTQGNQVLGRRCDAGGSWAAAVVIDADVSQSSRHPQVAFDANGNAMAPAWCRMARSIH